MRGTGMIERKDRKIAGVIFDVDGTLLDTMPVWRNSGARFLASLGIQAERGLGEKLFSETVETGAKYIVDKYRLEMSAQDVADGIDAQVAHAYESEAGFKPGAEKLLNTLKDQNIPMTVATSTRRHLIEMAFERLGIMDCFVGIFTAPEVGKTKGEPDIFHLAANRMGTPVRDTWVFEDGLYAIKTAFREGFGTVGVYDETSGKDTAEIKNFAHYYTESLEGFDFIEAVGGSKRPNLI